MSLRHWEGLAVQYGTGAWHSEDRPHWTENALTQSGATHPSVHS